MNKILISAVLLFSGLSQALAQTAPQLPVTTINGKSFYVYEVSADESLFGIAKKFGWDDNLLAVQNPDAASNLKKGQKLYYPAQDDSRGTAAESNSESLRAGAGEDADLTEIFYTADDTTDPYKIAKRLGITPDELYSLNPNARRGINRGDMLRAKVSRRVADSLQKSGEKAYTVVERNLGDDVIQVSSSPSLVTKRNVRSDAAAKSETSLNLSAQQPAREPAYNPAPEIQPAASDIVSDSTSDIAPDANIVADDAGSAVADEQQPFRSHRNPLEGLNESDLMQYIIQENDDLLTVANNYHTTIRDIFFLNPAVSDTYFPEDELIRLLPGSREKDRATVPVHSRVKTGTRSYKARKNETFASIASDNGISAEELKAENPTLKNVKKGKTVRIPLFKDVTEWKDSVMTDPREFTADGRNEIYREVRSELYSASSPRHDYEAVVITSTSAADRNREKDFLRGFLMGVNTLSTGGKTLGLKVIPVADTARLPQLLEEVEDIMPDIIFASYESNFPEEIVRFGRDNNIPVVNAFDAKSTDYEDNHNMIQVLIPSADMNRKIADELMRMADGRTVIFIADDNSDKESFSSFLKEQLRLANRVFMDYPTVASLQEFTLGSGKGYLIVPNLTRRNEIRDCLEYIGALVKEDPSLDVATVGRPTWITVADALDKQLAGANTFIPSRFYINNDDSDYTLFNDNYKSFFNEEPIRSFPAYAPLGYDVARYFLNTLLSGAEFTSPSRNVRNLEMDFNLVRPGEDSGLVNENMYFINYNPSGLVRKISF